MTVYEYDFVALKLTDEQKQMVQMGLANIEQLNTMLRDTINERAVYGWEPLYPFAVPALWFRRMKSKKTMKTA